MENQEKLISITQIQDGFQTIFPGSIKTLSVEEDEDANTFIFELELNEDVEELIIPDGIFVGFIDFKGMFVDGFIEGQSFIEFVREYK